MVRFTSFSRPTFGDFKVFNYADAATLSQILDGEVSFTPSLVTVSHPNLTIELAGSFTGTADQPSGTVTGLTANGPAAFGAPVAVSVTGLDVSLRALASAAEALDEEVVARQLWGGDDIFEGGSGADILHGGRGHDIILLGAGDDAGTGWTGQDELDGGEGADTLQGWEGNDLLGGGEGNDLLLGQPGRDTLIGGPGADTLEGGEGNDQLTGGLGRDMLTGAEGADRFLFASVEESSVSAPDVISDFNAAEGDRLYLRAIDAKAGTAEDDVFRPAQGSFEAGRPGRYLLEVATLDGQAGLLVQLETDGDAVADGTIFLAGITSLPEGALIG